MSICEYIGKKLCFPCDDDSESDCEIRIGADKEKEIHKTNYPSLRKTVIIKPPSLINVGATCYMNSAFQGISGCGTFVKDVEKLCKDYNDVEALHVFKELLDILNECSSRGMDISRNPIFREWNKPGQQDSYELLAYALNQVYNNLRKSMEEKTLIQVRHLETWLRVGLPMRLILEYTITCGCGMKTKSPIQTDLAFHVSIPLNSERKELSTLLGRYFDEDVIEDYVCDKKDCTGRGTKRIARLVHPLPKSICIHLQRTYWDGFRMKKINDRVAFDTTLIIKSEYCYDESINNGDNLATEEPAASEIEKLNNDLYNCDVDGNGDDGGVKMKENVVIKVNGASVSSNVCSEDGMESFNENGSDIDVMVERNEASSLRKTIVVTVSSDVKNCSKTDNGVETSDVDDNLSDNNGMLEESMATVVRKAIVDKKVSNKTDDGLGSSDVEENESNKDAYRDLTIKKGDQTYHLVSVINHSGTVSGGHYVCYKRVRDQWFLTDDSCVNQVKEEEVLRCQAYILFYEQPSEIVTSF